jgi:hypothetical protein
VHCIPAINVAPTFPPPSVQQSYHLTFCHADQPVLSGKGEISRDRFCRGKANETETIFIRPIKKYLYAMDFPISGYIFDLGQT